MTESYALFVAFVLGIVGPDEFLPVSSLGHDHRRQPPSGLKDPRPPPFEVVIQLGSIPQWSSCSGAACWAHRHSPVRTDPRPRPSLVRHPRHALPAVVVRAGYPQLDQGQAICSGRKP